ncbi:DUF2391 domain-containing protein [Natronomonas gomsonensis]|uniref:DUF2391 domain-containing protein n=1 Tax=Natronomonas gomsonensis TaxID=1046043 RepID=UPI0020CA3DCB|nr:DUF2391 domain-containing protein [Natronomonas gomsonensis]MCY4729168.1 DUF2391 domain-containing protein [Natronomonas gomsonensis]
MADEDPTTAEVLERLESLEESVSAGEERRRARRIRRLAEGMHRFERRTFDNVERNIQRYTTRDVLEAFVGSTIFSLPLVVEGGVLEIGSHFATSLVYGVPVYFLANAVFVVTITAGLLYYAEFREVEIQLAFGFVPKRLVGVLAIAFLTATATMALWGRLDIAEPFLSLCQISVVWTAGAFGAGLGDILPGENEGEEIGDLFGGT